jgi:RNA polymerase sigma-70 factor, ECF subfamily
MDDRQILERLRSGDESAFDTVFRTWYPPLVRAAESLLHERAAAEEVVQDVLLGVWRRREQLVLEQTLRAYLYQATRNRALNHLRREQTERRGEPDVAARLPSPAQASERVESAELERAIREAVRDLPDRCREVFELSRVHGLRYSEIASAMGISVKTVEVQMGKALRVLRERLSAWLPTRAGS